MGQSSKSLRPGQHPQHLSGRGTRRTTTAIVPDNVSRAKTLARIDVLQQFETERGLNRHRHEHMVMVAPYDPSHCPAAKAAVRVIENDHACVGEEAVKATGAIRIARIPRP
jgi:hypothetical protein